MKILIIITDLGSFNNFLAELAIECSKKYFRPSEVDQLLGDASKAKKILKWKTKVTFKELVHEMIAHDLELVKKNNVKEK